MIQHQITHYYQPTNTSCIHTSVAMLFSHLGKVAQPERIIQDVPVIKNAKGEDWGSPFQQLATWCIEQGFAVELHTADFQVIDLSWRNLNPDQQLRRLEAIRQNRNIPSLGQEPSDLYVQTYIDFVKAGGKLVVEPYMTEGLLDDLLQHGPIIISVCMNVLYQTGRLRFDGLRQYIQDDVNGWLSNHAVVVYGKGDDGKYLVADPWLAPGRQEYDAECLLSAMAAAQMECDNVLFQISEK